MADQQFDPQQLQALMTSLMSQGQAQGVTTMAPNTQTAPNLGNLGQAIAGQANTAKNSQDVTTYNPQNPQPYINNLYKQTYGTDAPPDQMKYWTQKFASNEPTGTGAPATPAYWSMRLTNPNYDSGPKNTPMRSTMPMPKSLGGQNPIGMGQMGQQQAQQPGLPNSTFAGLGGNMYQAPQQGMGQAPPQNGLGQIPNNINDILTKIQQRKQAQQNQPLQNAIQGPNNPFATGNVG